MTDVDYVREQLQGERIAVIVQGISLALALTDESLVTGKRGLFGRWGNRLERFPLTAVAAVQVIPNPTANVLRVEFAGTPPHSLAVVFPASAQAELRDMEVLLLEWKDGSRRRAVG